MLTTRQNSILCHIIHHPGATVADVANAIGLSTCRTWAIVSRLRGMGLVAGSHGTMRAVGCVEWQGRAWRQVMDCPSEEEVA